MGGETGGGGDGVGAPRWLRVVSRVVPEGMRDGWLGEWAGELSWVTSRTTGARARRGLSRWRLHVAVISDALWLRARSWRGLPRGGLTLDAWRSVRRRPGFAAAVIATLALGMGGVTTVFTVVDAALLRAMPYAGVDRVMEAAMSLPGGYMRMGVDWDMYEVWRTQTSVFEAMEARRERSVVVRGVGEPMTARAAWFTAGIIDMLGVMPERGRTFTAREMDVGGVTLVSENWLRRASVDASELLGKTVWIDDAPHEVIGIMPDEFRYPSSGTMIFLPMTERTTSVVPVGRLRRGLDMTNAAEAIGDVAGRLQAEQPREEGWNLYPMPLGQRRFRPGGQRALMLLLGGTLGVLLIGCVNVANLLLVSGTARTKELAIRAAMGATRARLVTQLMLESAFLALLAGVAGTLVAWAGVRVFSIIAPPSLTGFNGGPIQIDARALVVSGVLIVLTALLFGTGPALIGGQRHTPLANGERAATGGRGVRQARSALAIAELALAMTLLVTAGLLVRSLHGVLARDPGYDAERILAMDVWLPAARYPDLAAQRTFHEELVARLSALPAADGVTLAGQVPPVGGFQIGPEFQAEGQAPLSTQPLMVPNVEVDTSFFRVLGIEIIEGRGFDARDVATAEPVAVIDRDLARALWPGGSALGRRFRTSESSDVWLTVVGIANDVEMLGVADLRADECRSGACDFEVYRPLTQHQRLGQHGVAIRTSGDPLMLVQPVREILRAIDPEIPVPTPESGPGRIRTTLQEQRFVLRVMSAFTALAVVLAAIGVYGVLAYGVARRTREFGVRMALGANARDVLEDVLRRAASYALSGVTLGVIGALAAGRIVGGLLVDVSATDPIALGTAALTLGLIAMLAALLPALHALRIRPLDALRVE